MSDATKGTLGIVLIVGGMFALGWWMRGASIVEVNGQPVAYAEDGLVPRLLIPREVDGRFLVCVARKQDAAQACWTVDQLRLLAPPPKGE